MSQLETQLRRQVETLERDGLNLAAEVARWKQAHATQRRQYQARITKLENDLRTANATIRRLERELEETKKLRYLPTGILGPAI